MFQKKLTKKDITSTPKKKKTQTVILKCLQKAEWIFRLTRLLLYYFKKKLGNYILAEGL